MRYMPIFTDINIKIKHVDYKGGKYIFSNVSSEYKKFI